MNHSFPNPFFFSFFFTPRRVFIFFISLLSILPFSNIKLKIAPSDKGAGHILVQGSHIPSSSIFPFKDSFAWVKFWPLLRLSPPSLSAAAPLASIISEAGVSAAGVCTSYTCLDLSYRLLLSCVLRSQISLEVL